MSETENINTSEVALPIIGQFKPKRKFISFISGTKSGIRFVSNTALLSLKELTRTFEEDIILKFTICDEGTINVEEVSDTDITTPEMIQRFINDIDNRDVTGYTQKYVVHGLSFKSEDDKLCFLEVDEKKPIDKLSSLLDDLRSEVKPVSETGLSILDSLFGQTDETEVETENGVIETEDVSNETEIETEKGPSALELAFQKMNAEKIAELQKRIDKNLEEVKRLKHEVSSKEKLISDKSDEYVILQSRLKSLQPKPTPLGVYVFVSEENKTGITPDQALVDVVKKISPILKLKEDVVIDMLTKGYFTISLGHKEEFKLDKEIFNKVSSIDINGKFSVASENQIEYRGELTWHEILERLLQEGFEQDADFDKKSGSNSYQSEEEQEEKEHCHNDSCGCEDKSENVGNLNLENYIFSVDEIDGETWFAIQTKEHWDSEGCLDDQHQELDLGNKWGEAMESTFEYNGDIIDGIKDLLQKGIKFDPSFQSFMEQGSPFNINGILLKDYILQNYPNSLV
jgi:hypothetical protein